MENITGAQLDNTCAVFIRYKADERGEFALAIAGDADDTWGDRAVVVDVKPCLGDGHEGCRMAVVAPDDTDAIEYVHIEDDVPYAAQRP